MTHVCEIIAVGTELLLGNIANTDAQDISQALAELGINCYYHTTVGDNPARLSAALKIARSRADIIITTGGLGPTYDDLTKQTVCGEFDIPLVLHEPTWLRIIEFFERIGRPVTPNNRQQALVPENGYILTNDFGTAPGCGFTAKDGTQVFMLPGPPHECRPMLRGALMPLLRIQSEKRFVSRNIRITGMGESAVEDLLRGLMESSENPTLAPYAKDGEVLLRVTASAESEEAAFALTEPMVEDVRKALGSLVYGVDVDSLEQVVLRLLEENHVKLTVAESCTGGMIASRLTSVPGSSAHFMGGVIAYDTRIKSSVLDVSLDTLAEHGVVSRETALGMARGVCNLTGADIGIGVTGLAGPSGDGSGTALGTVCIALWDNRLAKGTAISHNYGDERYRVRTMSTVAALDMVRKHLTGVEIE